MFNRCFPGFQHSSISGSTYFPPPVITESTAAREAREDDIDAPDLKAPMPPTSAAAEPAPNRHGRLNGGQSIPGRNGSKAVRNPAKSILGAEASATLRDQLSLRTTMLNPQWSANWCCD